MRSAEIPKPQSYNVKANLLHLIPALLLCGLLGGAACEARGGTEQMHPAQIVQLPAPSLSGGLPLEAALNMRRSVRNYGDRPLRIEEVAQLLWAAQGVTEPGRGLRSSPSAGATFPLEILVAAGNVSGLAAGLYRYRPQSHTLESMIPGELRPALQRASLNQSPVRQAPAVFIITALPERTEARYGGRAMRYVLMEAGHAAQNLCLQAVTLGLGTVLIGAFHDADLAAILTLPAGEIPLYVIPAGAP